jgi:hypothetical protein
MIQSVSYSILTPTSDIDYIIQIILRFHMRTFTREEMHQELREILSISALNIGVLKSESAAVAYLETSREMDLASSAPLSPNEIAKIDLSKFAATEWLDNAYRMVFEPTSSDDLAWGPDYCYFDWILHAIPSTDRDGGTPPCLRNDGKIRWLLEYATVLSRALDIACFHSTGSFTVKDMSLLANMSEGAIRNALSSKKDFLSAGSAPEGGVRIERDVAFRWWAGRRSFRPRPTEIDKHWFFEMCREMPHEGLMNLRCRAHWNVGSVERMAAALNWRASDVENLLAGKVPKSKLRLQEFAKLVRIQPENFLDSIKLLNAWMERSK